MSRHVLVALTHSPESRRALEFAFDNFESDRITVIHVFNPAIHYGGEGFVDERVIENERDRAEDLLAEAAEAGGERGIDVETVLERGETKRMIIEYATEQDVDHLVLGSRGRSGVARLLLGSIAEGVVRRAPVPVTIVK